MHTCRRTDRQTDSEAEGETTSILPITQKPSKKYENVYSVYICTCVYTNIYLHIVVCTYAQRDTFTQHRIQLYIYVYIYVYIYTYTYKTCTQACITNIHTSGMHQGHTYTNMCTHTNRQTVRPRGWNDLPVWLHRSPRKYRSMYVCMWVCLLSFVF